MSELHQKLICVQTDLHQAKRQILGHRNQCAELRKQLATAIADRDAAQKEANRRDQKWMDGINEIVGRKLDYGDPSSPNCASKALEVLVKDRDDALSKLREIAQRLQVERVDDLNAEIKSLAQRKKEAEAKCAERRDALMQLLDLWKTPQTDDRYLRVIKRVQHALSGDCGKGFVRLTEVFNENSPWSLLETMKAAAEGLSHLFADHDCDCHGHEHWSNAEACLRDHITRLEALKAKLLTEGVT